MTKLPLEHPPFPPIHLVDCDKETVVDLADTILTEAIEDFERHLYCNNGVVNAAHWVRVKQVEDVVVYQDREALKERRLSRVNLSRNTRRNEILNLLWFGTIHGDLDNIMYAVVNRTTEEAKVKAACVESTLLDFDVLDTLVHPTVEDPFCGVQVKWAANAGPTMLRSVVRSRDFVYLESTGMTTMSTGERVGFQLLHSISIPGVPELHKYKFVRGNMTLFHLFRQKRDGVVEMYIKAFIDLMGDMPLRVATMLSTSGVVSVSKLEEYALMKKLNWLLSQRREIVPSDRSNLCHMCPKMIKGTLVRRRTCKICMSQCCARCCVLKKMFFMPLHSRGVVQKLAHLCKSCIQTASLMNGLDIAQEELSATGRQFKAYAYWSTTSPTTSTSSLML